ncbi:MAG: N-acetylmuramoyl-L-alanine amidase [Verrucomicrobiales bacterium]|nr:N-acetylmuramoyl-L-alanine amidase [Verrucomicrobiales bacterium]
MTPSLYRALMKDHGGKLFLAWGLLALVFFLGTMGAEAGFKTVIIDAGHGGHDLGASRSLIYEKHLNLDVARRLERTLRESGFRTVLTRSTDTFIPLSARSAKANKYRNAIFVSIHFNWSWKSKVTGIETFYRSSTSRNLASYIQRQLIGKIGCTNRGVKSANFSVLRKTRHPAVLVEGGFVSNKSERVSMLDARYRQVVADSIARGILEYRKKG